jgi:cytochrome c553
MTGVQYAVRGALGVGGTQLGALRNGGFDQARIDTSNAARSAYAAGGRIEFLAKVGVLATAEDITSAHLDLDGAGGVVSSGIAWGNGANGSGAGPGVAAVSCVSCHNPHGNGQYRILNPIPQLTATSGTFTAVSAPGVTVQDSPIGTPVAGVYPTKNYTVIQTMGNETTGAGFLFYAGQVTATAAQGDYFHRYVPWNQTSNSFRTADGPNGMPSTFNTQMTSWCISCHSRYMSAAADVARPGDTIFKYQHQTVARNAVCTTCHVAHGSNAKMTGTYSAVLPQPNGTQSATVGDSRLLKIDDRGTCNACHDPTGTVLAGAYTGPVFVPVAP